MAPAGQGLQFRIKDLGINNPSLFLNKKIWKKLPQTRALETYAVASFLLVTIIKMASCQNIPPSNFSQTTFKKLELV